MKVFIAATSLRPAYGGPAYSVARLARALAEAGAEVGLWAADGEVPSISNVRPLGGRESDALDAFGRPDVLHDNGLWLPHNHRLAMLAARRGIPRLVSTRGMLEPWAIRHKGWKKCIAWALYQRRDLARASMLHATAEAEAQTLEGLGLGVPVRTIANGIDLPEARAAAPRETKVRTALFLGRLYPVKGLPTLVEAWARARPQGWRLEIAGPDEAGHRAEIERAITRAGLGAEVSFTGAVDGARKEEAFANAELLVLPSYSESFGMVVGEALAHNIPVLTTLNVPWPMLEARGCGWRVEASAEGLAQGLRTATAADRETLAAMGARGRELIAAEFGWDRIAARFLAACNEIRNDK